MTSHSPFTVNIFWLIATLLFIAITPHSALGLSSQLRDAGNNVGIAGASGAYGMDAFAVYYNPATMRQVLSQNEHYTITYNFSSYQYNFSSLPNIVLNNLSLGSEFQQGTWEWPQKLSFEQSIGLIAAVPLWDVTIFLGAYVTQPLEFSFLSKTLSLELTKTYHPKMVRYGHHSSMPKLHFSMSSDAWEGFSIGAGLIIAFDVIAAGNLELSLLPEHNSVMDFNTIAISRAAPSLGLLYETPSKSFTAGFTARLSLPSRVKINFDAKAHPVSVITFNIEGHATYHYEPASLEWAMTWEMLPLLRWFAQLNWEFYSAYEIPVMLLSPHASGSGVGIIPTAPLDVAPRNTLNPKLGLQYQWNDTMAIQVGYLYRPSMFEKKPSGNGNLLDLTAHILRLAHSKRFKNLFTSQVTLDTSLSAEFTFFEPLEVTKTSGSEMGLVPASSISTQSYAKIGSSSYTAKGYGWSVGASCKFNF